MSKLIDAKGQSCPIPVVMAKQAISGGETAFTVEVDNQTAVENLKRLAASQGFTVAVHESAGAFALDFLKDGAAPPACEAVPDASAPVPDRHTAILIGRDIIGSGDRELGTNLMRMFFYTLAGSDDLPQSILFMNGGVKLPALDDQVAGHLKDLQSKGVELLVCGTCLNFYGIADKLQVGTVSNMYDILSRMQSAAKVITV